MHATLCSGGRGGIIPHYFSVSYAVRKIARAGRGDDLCATHGGATCLQAAAWLMQACRPGPRGGPVERMKESSMHRGVLAVAAAVALWTLPAFAQTTTVAQDVFLTTQ